MSKTLKHLKKIVLHADFRVFLFLLIFSPLFFYNINGYSLEDFDEAWYGEIARNIVISRNPLLLEFNGKPFYDHPPVGYILMAMSIKVFGANEFGVRFPSSALGFFSIVLIYFIGKNLFDRRVGIAASLILVSCVWFILRVRSGNLDSILVFFYLLTFYFTVKLKVSKNYIFALSASLAALTLTKMLIGLSILAPIGAFILINRIKIPFKYFLKAIGLYFMITLPWFALNYLIEGNIFLNRIITIGLRPGGKQDVNYPEILRSQTFTYLHFGIRKWYYFALLSLPVSILLIFKNRNLVPLIVWVFILVWAFIHNSKTEIWHLIPLYIPLALIIAFVAVQATDSIFKSLKKFTPSIVRKNYSIILFTIPLLPIFVISVKLIYDFRNEIKLTGENKIGLVETAKAAKKYPETLFLDNDLPVPAVAAFYSQKQVYKLTDYQHPYTRLKNQVLYGQTPFLLLTEKWKLDLDKVDPQMYDILWQSQGHLLIKVERNLSNQPTNSQRF